MPLHAKILIGVLYKEHELDMLHRVTIHLRHAYSGTALGILSALRGYELTLVQVERSAVAAGMQCGVAGGFSEVGAWGAVNWCEVK